MNSREEIDKIQQKNKNYYNHIEPRVRSIRREDDNVLKKPKNFDKEYGELI